MDNLAPVSVANNLKFATISPKHGRALIHARSRGVCRHLLKAPVVPRSADVELADTFSLELLCQSSCFTPLQLLPGDGAPTSEDSELHAVCITRQAEVCSRKLRLCTFSALSSHQEAIFAELLGHLSLENFLAAINHPIAAMSHVVGPKNSCILVASLISRMQNSRRVSIKPYLELLVPHLRQDYSEAVDSVTFCFHWLRVGPLRPGAHDHVGSYRQRFAVQSAATTRPKHDLVSLRDDGLLLLLLLASGAPHHQIYIRATEPAGHYTIERTRSLILHVFRNDRHRLILQICVRIGLAKVQVWC
mmetsp:Transcript_23097/g.41735  ORF Transcript_23097/g.41735 Transcript_23097/m.41735 type:complete len:304 (-) Transcript_23097:2028-2939(-)